MAVDAVPDVERGAGARCLAWFAGFCLMSFRTGVSACWRLISFPRKLTVSGGAGCTARSSSGASAWAEAWE